MIEIIKTPKTKPMVIQATLLEVTDLEKNNIIDVVSINLIKATSTEWMCTIEAEIEVKKQATKDLLNSSEMAMLFFTKLANTLVKPKRSSK
jgi:hypothetical protein